ncbi:trigger factor [Uliginosibacterium aquaticum]|uniref:Trigger factor n=1 Tax=Uliginosibacterium aquaticum TaxID=2731212 RepID=A0ABX2ILR6_9RHOO|nr:trigger factor [Uliginosibacterium aquaticum]NSL56833.1 trigger factor [Uliginosibacterium aquaticum]
MQTNEVTLGALERRIDLVVNLAEVEAQVAARLKNLGRTVKMAGFRPGKVPLKMVEQSYGPQVRNEVLGDAVEAAFSKTVQEQNLRVAGYPNIVPKETSVEGKMEFVATFEVFPEVAVGDLAASEIERPSLAVGDAEVDRTIEVLRKQRTTFVKAERASQEGDRVTIDFTGRKDGEVFEGGQASDFPVVVGGGQMLPDFDAALRGLNVGDSKTFDLTFPAEYHAANLAGQTVQFEIALKAVEAPVLPEVDATFAQALGVPNGDTAKMREEIKANLEREVARRIRARVRDQALEVLSKACAFDVPKALVDGEAGRMVEAAKRDLVQRGVDVKNVPVSKDWFTEQASNRVKLGLIVAEVVGKNSLNAKPEQIRARVDDLAQTYEKPEDVVRWYYSKPEHLRDIEDAVVEDNVVEWVLGQAKVSDKGFTFEELMEQAQQA